MDLPKVASRALRGRIPARGLIGWLLPVGLGAVFLALFAVANPVIEGWLAAIDPTPLLAIFDVQRIAFWLVLAVFVWPFVFFRLPRREAIRLRVSPEGGAPNAFLSTLVGDAAMLRSLVLFNAMFAVQTALDAAILWRGQGLPVGMSFAAYAHRGAYPLTATALLAGAFVVLTMRPAAPASRSPLIQTLVYLWVGQNVALVASSLYRLDLYVRIYSLTYWRVAAFVWMALVALGLVLIIAQMSAQRSNRWLLSTNAAAAAAALYLCAGVNFDFLIADYNLSHCHEVDHESAELDLDYLRSLGPDAIPALDAALAAPGSPFVGGLVSQMRYELEAMRDRRDGDWRSWTFRAWRLSRILGAAAAKKP
jgi:Domain of unknown function (DUF4173)